MAYQLAFDLENNATQKYLTKVNNALPVEPADAGTSKFQKVKSILSGKETIKLQLEFLCRNNHTDMLILKNSKVRRRIDTLGRDYLPLSYEDLIIDVHTLVLVDCFGCPPLNLSLCGDIRQRLYECWNHQ